MTFIFHYYNLIHAHVGKPGLNWHVDNGWLNILTDLEKLYKTEWPIWVNGKTVMRNSHTRQNTEIKSKYLLGITYLV